MKVFFYLVYIFGICFAGNMQAETDSDLRSACREFYEIWRGKKMPTIEEEERFFGRKSDFRNMIAGSPRSPYQPSKKVVTNAKSETPVWSVLRAHSEWFLPNSLDEVEIRGPYDFKTPAGFTRRVITCRVSGAGIDNVKYPQLTFAINENAGRDGIFDIDVTKLGDSEGALLIAAILEPEAK